MPSSDSEIRKATKRARYARIKADPVKYEALLKRQRESAKKRYDRDPEKQREYRRKNYARVRASEVASRTRHKDRHNEFRRNTYKTNLIQLSRPCPSSCESCGRESKLVWDHNHETGEFRGWLCTQCNVALGMLGENLSTILQLGIYLENSQQSFPNAREGGVLS